MAGTVAGAWTVQFEDWRGAFGTSEPLPDPDPNGCDDLAWAKKLGKTLKDDPAA